MVSRRRILLAVSFLASYFIVYLLALISNPLKGALGSLPVLGSLVSLLFPWRVWDLSGLPFRADFALLLLPAVGFFSVYWLAGWANGYFGNREGDSFWIPVLLVVLGLPAFYVSVWWYYGNISQLVGQTVPFDFWSTLRESYFIQFLAAGLLGWVSRRLLTSGNPAPAP